MGYGIATGLKEAVKTGLTDLDQALVIHLRSNHYPPLPYELVKTCKDVIDACNDDDDRLIDLPAGITWKSFTQVPARVCCEAWHLDAFLVEESIS